jgi:hypothetical protein
LFANNAQRFAGAQVQAIDMFKECQTAERLDRYHSHADASKEQNGTY